jgi:hypothetical protein
VQLYFLSMVLGLPLVILALALLAGHFHRDGYAELLDWKPTRSPEREVELERAWAGGGYGEVLLPPDGG